MLAQAFFILGIQIQIIRGTLAQKFLNLFLILTFVIHLIALDKYFQEKRTNTAVVIGNGVDAYSAPSFGNKTILFRINEGSIADVSNKQNDWTEIILIDGKKGWVPNEALREMR